MMERARALAMRFPRPLTGAATVVVAAAAVAAVAVTLLAPGVAQAQIMGEPTDPYPDARKFARGVYAEAEAGAVLFLGEAQKPLGPGMALGARVGFDFFSWVALQVHALFSNHTTDFGSTPGSGQLLQLWQGTAELKLTLPLGQWSLFGYGGGGMARLSTNLLGTTGLTDQDVRNTPVTGGGGGVDYHTRSRHFSFGLAGGFVKLAKLRTTGAAHGALYLRYTF
jgi:hypothetical protein